MNRIFCLDVSNNQIAAIVAERSKRKAGDFAAIEKIVLSLEHSGIIFSALKQDNTIVSEDETPLGEPIAGYSPELLLWPILELYKKYEKSMRSAGLILSPQSYISLEVELPFSKRREIEKVIDFEIQDDLAFSPDDFFLNFAVRRKEGGGEGAHVQTHLISHQYLQNLLFIFKDFRLTCLTVPPAILYPLADFSPRAAEPSESEAAAQNPVINQALLVESELAINLMFLEGEQILTTQIINKSLKNLFPGSSLAMLFENIKQKISNRELDLLTVICSDQFFDRISQLGYSKEVKRIEAPEPDLLNCRLLAQYLFQNKTEGTASESSLVNFRSGKYAYPFLLNFLSSYFSKVWLYLLIFLFLLTAIPVSQYLLRSLQISELQKTINQTISENLPAGNVPAGMELDYLIGQTNLTAKELADLGAKAQVKPFEVFLIINRIFSDNPLKTLDYSLNKIVITSRKINLDGSAPDYKAVGQIERYLKREPSFCSVKLTQNNAVRNRRTFKFELELCTQGRDE